MSLGHIRIFRHDSWIEAGCFTEALERNQFSYELIAVDQGDPVSLDVEGIGGIAFLGGTMSVNDSLTWINDELNLIRLAAEKNVPVFGHCFGAQLISKALGGKITTMPAKEIGWHAIKFQDNEVCRQWFSHLPDTLDVMLWHEDCMTIPTGAIPLYSTVHNPNQAFTVGNIVATIPHLELTAHMLSNWLDIYGDDLTPLSSSVQSVEEVKRNLEQRVNTMHQLTNALYDRWFGLVDMYLKR